MKQRPTVFRDAKTGRPQLTAEQAAGMIRDVKSGQFKLTGKQVTRFSAVEGQKLSPRMEGVAREIAGKSKAGAILSGAERRELVKAALRTK